MTSCVPRGAAIFCDMNSVIVTLCAILALAMLPAPVVRGVLATAAGSLFEGTPFILAGVALHALLARVGGARSWATAITVYLGCGCGDGASARSLPAAVATALAFGPAFAVLRIAAATLASAAIAAPLHPVRHPEHSAEGAESRDLFFDPLSQLASLLPAAAVGGAILALFSTIRVESVPASAQVAIGALFGVASSPCALGTVALAASLHVRAPLASYAMLCTSGILDLRALRRAHDARVSHDVLAYALAAIALAAVGLREGGALVHPKFSAALLVSALGCASLAVVYRRSRSPHARFAPAVMLAGALFAAPAPTYTATETTLTDLFVGEHIVFTGELVHGADADAVARFAITCCRADAAPVVIRLARRTRAKPGTWLRVDGDVVRDGAELRLDVRHTQTVASPRDPFIYR